MRDGWIYAFWHPQAPANTVQTVRVKIGRSDQPLVWGGKHEFRGEKLAFALDMFGFRRQIDVFPPISVSDSKASERKLKDELRPYLVTFENGGRCEEAYDLPWPDFFKLTKRTEV